MSAALPDGRADRPGRAPTRLESAVYLRDMLFGLAKIAEQARLLPLHAVIVAAHAAAVDQHERLRMPPDAWLDADERRT